MKNTPYAMLYAPMKYVDGVQQMAVSIIRESQLADHPNHFFLETRTLENGTEMDVIVPRCDLEYWDKYLALQQHKKELKDQEALLSPEERYCIELERVDQAKADEIARAVEAYGGFERGLTMEQFADRYMNLKNLNETLLSHYEPEFMATVMAEVEEVKKQEYQMYLKGTAC